MNATDDERLSPSGRTGKSKSAGLKAEQAKSFDFPEKCSLGDDCKASSPTKIDATGIYRTDLISLIHATIDVDRMSSTSESLDGTGRTSYPSVDV